MPLTGEDYADAFIEYLGDGDGQLGASPGDTYARLARDRNALQKGRGNTMAVGSFAKRREEAEKAGLLGKGDYLKLKEGANRFRLFSECVPFASTYQGKRNFKWVCYVIDRTDGKVKPYFMPHKIYKQIEALQVSEDYGFSDVPMPYDLTVMAEKAGTIDVVYTLVPARKETPITDAEFADFGAQKTLGELIAMLVEKQQKDEKAKASAPPAAPPHTDDDHSGPVDESDIPF